MDSVKIMSHAKIITHAVILHVKYEFEQHDFTLHDISRKLMYSIKRKLGEYLFICK